MKSVRLVEIRTERECHRAKDAAGAACALICNDRFCRLEHERFARVNETTDHPPERLIGKVDRTIFSIIELHARDLIMDPLLLGGVQRAGSKLIGYLDRLASVIAEAV